MRASALLLMLSGILCNWPLHSATGPDSTELMGELELRTLDGQRLRLQDMQGQPVLISFWSTSCAICLTEMPEMNRLNRALSAAGARLVSVTMPYDPPNHVVELSAELKVEFPVAIDLDGSISEAFAAPGTPYKVLLGKNGQVAETFVGALNYRKTLESVNLLLAEP